MLNWFRFRAVGVCVSALASVFVIRSGECDREGPEWPSRQAWEHIAVTPLGSSGLRGPQVESECCQFGRQALTTALSGSSSDRPISADAKPRAHRNCKAKPRRRGRVSSNQGWKRGTSSVSPQWAAWSSFHCIPLWTRMAKRHLPFISAPFLFSNSCVSSAKRKLKHQTLLIMRRGLVFFFRRMFGIERAVLPRPKDLSSFENKANRI